MKKCPSDADCTQYRASFLDTFEQLEEKKVLLQRILKVHTIRCKGACSSL